MRAHNGKARSIHVGPLLVVVLALTAAPRALAQREATPEVREHHVVPLFLESAESPDGDPVLRRFECPASQLRLEEIVAGTSRSPLTSRLVPPPALEGELLFTGDLPEGDTPSGIAFTPDGTELVVAHRDSRNLIVFDAATRVFLREIALSGSPQDVAISSDGIHAVAPNVFEDTVSIVDLTTGLETAVVPVGDQPGVVRITPDGTTAVVGNTVDSDLSVIDIATATELRRIPNAGFVGSVSAAFEPGVVTASFSEYELADDSTIVHPDYYADRVRIFYVGTGAETTLVTDANPRVVAVTPDGSTAVVSHTSSVQKISVIDVSSRTVTKTIAIGADCWGPICIRPDAVKAVVAVQNACRFVDLVTDAVSTNISTASVYELLTTADGSYAMCIGYYGSLIDFGTGSLLGNLNGIVSCPLGAVSPAGPRAAMVANTFGEDLVVVNTNGASGHTEGIVPSGPPPEADKTRTVAITPDRRRAVAVNILSDNASIVDLVTGTVEAIVDLGNRPAEVAITPDGTLAVVCNLDSSFASIIDLATFAVTNVNISRRASQVEISPDGRYAYLCVVADGDGVWRIDLDTLSVDGPKIATANMGGIYFLFHQSSGMTLSHDGSTLVVCGTYDDRISIVDATTWTLVKNVDVGEWPVRAVFAPDDSSIFVSCRNADAIDEVSNAGAGSDVVRTIGVGDYPFEMTLSPSGTTLYVVNYYDQNVGIVDLTTGVMTKTIALPDYAAGLHLDGPGRFLYVPTGTWSVSIGPGPVFSISYGGDVSVIDTRTGSVAFALETGLPPAMIAFAAHDRFGLVPSPFGDGLIAIYPPLAYPEER